MFEMPIYLIVSLENFRSIVLEVNSLLNKFNFLTRPHTN